MLNSQIKSCPSSHLKTNYQHHFTFLSYTPSSEATTTSPLFSNGATTRKKKCSLQLLKLMFATVPQPSMICISQDHFNLEWFEKSSGNRGYCNGFALRLYVFSAQFVCFEIFIATVKNSPSYFLRWSKLLQTFILTFWFVFYFYIFV
jgi:hypothetical protein